MSDADGYLERTFMSPAAVRAGKLLGEWMEDAGLRTLAFDLPLIRLCFGAVE